MRALKIICIVVPVLVGLFFLGKYLFERNLQKVDYGPLAELFKARAGEALMSPPCNPAVIKEDAKVLDTFMKAGRVGTAAAELSTKAPFPETSLDIKTLEPAVKVDAWGRPFCLARADDRIYVVSGGPKEVDISELKRSISCFIEVCSPKSGILFKLPSGIVITVVPTESGGRRQQSSKR